MSLILDSVNKSATILVQAWNHWSLSHVQRYNDISHAFTTLSCVLLALLRVQYTVTILIAISDRMLMMTFSTSTTVFASFRMKRITQVLLHCLY